VLESRQRSRICSAGALTPFLVSSGSTTFREKTLRPSVASGTSGLLPLPDVPGTAREWISELHARFAFVMMLPAKKHPTRSKQFVAKEVADVMPGASGEKLAARRSPERSSTPRGSDGIRVRLRE